MLPTSPFTSADARRFGLSRRELDEMVRCRRVRRVMHDVYVDAALPDTTQLRVMAAARVVTPGCVFCDRTAAGLHGVDVLDFHELDVLPPLECVVPPDRHRVERRGCRGGERDLAPYDVMVLGAVRVTTPLRTALDLGCLLPRPAALAALDQFARLHGVTTALLTPELPRYRGRRHVVQLRGLVPLVDGRAESPGESRVRLAIHDDALPAPKPQHWVTEHGVPVFRLDLAYPKHRVAVEYDGADWHDLTDEQRDSDERRREWLRERGWTVIVVSRSGLSRTAQTGWLTELRAALRLP